MVIAATVIVVLLVIGLGYATISGGGQGRANSSTEVLTSQSALIIFNADAYGAEVQTFLSGFANFTGIPVAPPHSGGSFALASQIASGSQDDVFVPVSLSATAPSHLENFSSNWAIGFASDQMVIAYSNSTSSYSSAGQKVISAYQRAAKSNASSDWDSLFSSLTSGQVKVGIADPNADPAGLRGWLVLEAAGALYRAGNTSAYTDALLASGGNVTGSAAANMVAPLEAGQMQFLFVYRSVAIAQHLGYFQLDHRVNLGDPKLASSYAILTYRLATGPTTGAPIILCVTVPTDSLHPSEADQFVQYVLKNSETVLPAFGLQAFAPPLLYNNTAPPAFVSQMVSQALIGSGGRLGP